MNHGKRETERFNLDLLRSSIFVTNQGFFYLIPINESFMLGSVADWTRDYQHFFSHVRETAICSPNSTHVFPACEVNTPITLLPNRSIGMPQFLSSFITASGDDTPSLYLYQMI
jgi:hypothetical protein